MERRNKLAEESPPRSVEKAAAGSSPLSNIAELIRPMGCVAIANDVHQSLAMLVRHKGESLPQLLERLDLTVGRALHKEIYTDEINNHSAT